MQIWSAEIKELERLYESIKGQLPDLEKEMERLIKADDENMILLYSRRCLEVIITNLCECELKRDRGTEPLKGIIDKLHKEKKIPPHIIASIHSLNELSTFGTHPKDFDPEQVKPVLVNLDIIIKWYLKYKDTQAITNHKATEVKGEVKLSEDSSEHIHKSKKGLIVLLSGLTLVVAIVVITLVVFNIIGGGSQNRELEKSIAVLPFKNDSPDQERMYFINGTMEAILDNLCKINDLRIPGRTSVEQYRENLKPIPTIAKELDVNYILEGSGHRDGNNVILFVQLLDGKKDKHLWSNTYDADIEEIFSMYSEIAQSVAEEIKAIITPEEKDLIEKVPTTNLTAYDFYQRGKDELEKYSSNNVLTRKEIERAEEMFKKALENDSSFALAYIGLARVYRVKHYWSEYFTENFLDSVLILSDRALFHNDKLSEAYAIKGRYYSDVGNYELANKEIETALKLNPNDWSSYLIKAQISSGDLVTGIESYSRVISLNRGSDLPAYLRLISKLYVDAGFAEKAKDYVQEALKLDGDSVVYYSNLCSIETWSGNHARGFEIAKKVYNMDSTNIDILHLLGHNYMFQRKYKESLISFKKYIDSQKTSGSLNLVDMESLGFANWQVGNKEEAEYCFNKEIEYCHKAINLGRSFGSKGAYYELAAIQAVKGDRDNAYKNLEIFWQSPKIEDLAIYIENFRSDPIFDNLRDESEFKELIVKADNRFQAEHEKVRRWLEEQGMI